MFHYVNEILFVRRLPVCFLTSTKSPKTLDQYQLPEVLVKRQQCPQQKGIDTCSSKWWLLGSIKKLQTAPDRFWCKKKKCKSLYSVQTNMWHISLQQAFIWVTGCHSSSVAPWPSLIFDALPSFWSVSTSKSFTYSERYFFLNVTSVFACLPVFSH